MAIKYAITKYPFGFPSKTLASNGGKHIYSVTVSEDTPNGLFVGKGDFVELDHYKEAAAGSVEGKIVAQAENGNYYVEITSCDEGTLFVYQVPVIEEEYNNSFKAEDNFFNGANTEVRAYQLAPGDVVELNAKALGLSAAPSAYPVSVSATAYGTSSLAKQLA